MNEDGQIEDEEPSWEAEAERESPPETLYDPLIDPWNDPASTSVVEYRVSQQETRAAFRADAGRPYPTQPYADEFTELRRRLRQGTVVVPRRPRIWSVTIREMAETLLLAILIFLAVRASMQNFRVEGQSMQPSMDNGEYLIVNKLTYSQIDLSIFDWIPFFDSGANPVHHLWTTPHRGDVIVFRAPISPDRDFIKRIIGVPGDVVEIEPTTGKVTVKGRRWTSRISRARPPVRPPAGPGWCRSGPTSSWATTARTAAIRDRAGSCRRRTSSARR